MLAAAETTAAVECSLCGTGPSGGWLSRTPSGGRGIGVRLNLVIQVLRTIGEAGVLVGPWSATRRFPCQVSVRVASRITYEDEPGALEVAELIVPRLVPTSYALAGQPKLRALEIGSGWLAQVSLELHLPAA